MKPSQPSVEERARRVQARRGPDEESVPARGRADGPPYVRTKPVRITTDLAPNEYRNLVACCSALANELGRARVSHSEVIRGLIALLETDEALGTALASRLRDQAAEREPTSRHLRHTRALTAADTSP